MVPAARKKSLLPPLRIDTVLCAPHVAVAPEDCSSLALSSATSDPDFLTANISHTVRSPRNMKNLSITLPTSPLPNVSVQLLSDHALQPTVGNNFARDRTMNQENSQCYPSPLPSATSSTALIHRKEEDGSPTVPYADGPTQIIPGIWLGSEENARDWKGLIERGIKSILNVAKEVTSPFDNAPLQPLRGVASTPNLKHTLDTANTYYPPHFPSGRPGMYYMKLQWSHGQQDLVDGGFQEAMRFTDAALYRREGVLIHCQCGISRSATMVIALVMRAAAERSTSVPPEVWGLDGMQDAYAFVKKKSKHVGPNMSLIYQLMEYEKQLKGERKPASIGSDNSTSGDDEEEWGKKRGMLEDPENKIRDSNFVMQEAQALDKAMEARIIARRASASSLTSSGSGGVGGAWRNRYPRKRTSSNASNATNGTVLTEDLPEEEERGLLGIGSDFDDECNMIKIRDVYSIPSHATDEDKDSGLCHDHLSTPNSDNSQILASKQPVTASAWKTSFQVSLPLSTSTIGSNFDLSSPLSAKANRRPSPIRIQSYDIQKRTLKITDSLDTPWKPQYRPLSTASLPATGTGLKSRNSTPPPLHLRKQAHRRATAPESSFIVTKPTQTLFVFPRSPSLTSYTPSTMTLTSNMHGSLLLPISSTPRVSTFRSQGRTRSFIGFFAPTTPTIGFSKVDARGYAAGHQQ